MVSLSFQFVQTLIGFTILLIVKVLAFDVDGSFVRACIHVIVIVSTDDKIDFSHFLLASELMNAIISSNGVDWGGVNKMSRGASLGRIPTLCYLAGWL